MLAVSVGDRPAVFARYLAAIVELRARVGRPPPPVPSGKPKPGQALFWAKGRNERPEVVTLYPPAAKAERHKRKCADGELGEDN